MGSAQVSIAAEWEVGDDNPTSAEKDLVWHWGKMTHNPSKTVVNFLSSVFSWVFFIFFLLFLPATCGGGSGGAMEEEIEREKRRFRKQRERESQTFFFLGIRDRL